MNKKNEKKTGWLVTPEEEDFLAGPDTFGKEILRLSRIIAEYVHGFYAFRNLHRCVTVLGSARFQPNHRF